VERVEKCAAAEKKKRLPNASKDVETQVRQMDCDLPSDPTGSPS